MVANRRSICKKRPSKKSQTLLNVSDIHEEWAIALRSLFVAHVKVRLSYTAREDQISPIKSFSLVQDGTLPSYYVMSVLQVMCANATGAFLTPKVVRLRGLGVTSRCWQQE